jgi:hypothetical protein
MHCAIIGFLILAVLVLAGFIVAKKSGWFASSTEMKNMGLFTKTPTLENPLKIEQGQYVNLKTLDEEGIQFQVSKIIEYDRILHGNTHKFTDYLLVGRPLNGDPIQMKLRMNPTADKLPIGMNQKILKLQLTDQSDWNQDLYNALTTEPDGKKADDPDFIEYNDDDSEKAKWWRINGVKTPYEATTLTLNDPKGKPSSGSLKYWDFNRDTKMGSIDRTQYMFVEMSDDAHQFEFWTGIEINESEIS